MKSIRRLLFPFAFALFTLAFAALYFHLHPTPQEWVVALISAYAAMGWSALLYLSQKSETFYRLGYMLAAITLPVMHMRWTAALHGQCDLVKWMYWLIPGGLLGITLFLILLKRKEQQHYIDGPSG